jgi:hypothetical protein
MRYVILALALLFAIPAHADQQFAFTMSNGISNATQQPDPLLIGSGIFTTTDLEQQCSAADGSAHYHITDISGSFEGNSISDPIPAAASCIDEMGHNDLISNGDGTFQPAILNTIEFSSGNFDYIMNVDDETSFLGPYVITAFGPQGEDDSALNDHLTLTIVQAPEPSSLLLLLSSLPLIYCGRKRHSPGLSVN